MIVAAIHFGTLAGSVWLARRLKCPRGDQIAVGFSASQKTLMVGLTSAMELGLSVIPIVTYHAIQLIGDTSVANLRPVANALPDLSAIVRGRLTIGGTTARPVLIGTLEVEDAIVGQLVLGDALLSVTTRDHVIEVSAFDQDLFGGFSLERANLTLDGMVPRRFEATVRARDKKLGELVPDLADAAVSVVGSSPAA